LSASMKSFLQSIGHYQILEKLGRGGMADVYLALDTTTNRQVALKLVERGSSQDSQEILAAERLGARLQAYLCTIDPRIPRIHNCGDLDGHFYIDMEYVAGRDLAEILREGPIEPRAAARIAIELCDILSKAHSCSLEIEGREIRAIVHGDIKPTNVRLDRENRVRVLDFGIAKGLSLTRKLTINCFGSASYSSPERLETGRIDALSDLWAVGVVLYEMVEGRLPFEAPSPEKLENILRGRIPPQPLSNSCPRELQEIIFKALARSPERRYQNAGEFESDLKAFDDGRLTLAGREKEQTRRSEEVPVDAGLTRRETASPGHQAKATRSRLSRRAKMVLISVGAGLLLLLATAVLWEVIVFRSARRLAATFESQQVDGDTAWVEYEDIKARSLVGIAPLALRPSLKGLLVADCERVIDEYRNNDVPRARESDWARCKRYMTHARELDPADAKTVAMVEYSDGHLLRISRKDADAVAAFQRAASLQPKWPDPYLGMARSFIYGLRDVERGIRALKRADDLGHKPGKREQAQFADAYKTRAAQFWSGSKKLRNTPQEEDLLSKAKEDLERALDLYSDIAPWGESTTQIRSTQELLTEVKSRLELVNPPKSIFNWKW
jgi:Protein kinase domain